MEAILPFGTLDRDQFCANALKIGFEEFVVVKFVYVFQDSDLDVFQLMGQDRLSLLLYGWEVCDAFINETTRQQQEADGDVSPHLPENVRAVMKRLTHYSLELWFSREWEKLAPRLQSALIVCLQRAKLDTVPELSLLNWEYLFRLGLKPWAVPYLGRFENTAKPTELTSPSIETVEEPASDEDIAYLQKEGLFVILLRLIKMFDTGSMEGVKIMSMRIIAAWNRVYEQMKENSELDFPKVRAEHKSCLVLICHIYLMTVYESDDIRGFVIDNMMNNIRFYHQNIPEKTGEDDSIEELEFTPARYIAMTCVNLRMCSSFDFFESFIFDTFDECFTTLFGVISQAYMSYILGNLLMEMNNMNEQDFNANVLDFKRFMNLYVLERERSEQYMLCQMRNQEAQRNSHNINVTIKNMTDYKSNICKGNRKSNIANYECADDAAEEKDEKGELEHQESDRRSDPIFQNIPNNEKILNYVYDVLAKRTYKGWHFAKLVLLLKIIGHELNVIETWRYHPGLTINFMLSLETKLSHHYEDLAKIFLDHDFMEQEFWLTAFYLDPNPKYYEAVMKCGMRYNRKRTAANDANDENAKQEAEKPLAATTTTGGIIAKFGLLSSTIDVQEIVGMTNHDAPNADYEPLSAALRSFRLPDVIIKDLLTVTFLPRNKSFAWAVNWVELRGRCKILLNNPQRKRRFVELNMAEANDRLKFLKIDYEKYKHRPQLDYGTIEVGYENVLAHDDDFGGDSDIDMFEDDVVKEEQPDGKESGKKRRRTEPNRKYEYKSEEEEEEDKTDEASDISETYFTGTRRTRARIAAAKATALFRDEQRTRRVGKSKEDSNDSTDSKSIKSEPQSPPPAAEEQLPTPTPQPTETSSAAASEVVVAKRNLEDLLKECTTYNNATSGFKSFPDIWQLESQEMHTMAEEDLLEGNVLEKFAKLKILKKANADLQEEQTQKVRKLHSKKKFNRKLKATHLYRAAAVAPEPLPLEDEEFEEEEAEEEEEDDDESENDDDETAAAYINTLNETEGSAQSLKEQHDANMATASLGSLPTVGDTKRKKSATDTDDTDETRSASETAEYMEECRLAERRKSLELLTKSVATRNKGLPTTAGNNADVHSSTRLSNTSLNQTQTDEFDSNSSDTSMQAMKDCQEVTESESEAIKEPEEKSQLVRPALGQEIVEAVEVIGKSKRLQNDAIEKNMTETKACDKEMQENKIVKKDSTIQPSETGPNEITPAHTEKQFETIGSPKIQVQQKTETEAKTTTKDEDSLEAKITKLNVRPVNVADDKKKDPPEKSTNAAEQQAVLADIESQMKSMHAETDEDDEDDTQPLSQIKMELDDASEHTEKSSACSENNELFKQCAQKTLSVTLRRLTVSDVCQLRQPMVRLKRVNMEEALLEQEQCKRRRVQRKFYADLDECSRSSSGGGSLYSDSNSRSKKPAPSKRTAIRGSLMRFIAQRKRNTSESSTESEDFKIRRRIGRPSRGRGRGGSNTAASTSQRGRGAKSLTVTPRSASGLKLRISSAGTDSGGPGTSASAKLVKLVKRAPIVDYIQISSSSDDAEQLNKFLSPVVELLESDISGDDPLFEEEIITFD